MRPRHATFFGLAAAALVLAAATGCATLARQAFANPVVEVKDARVTAIGFNGGSVDVFLEIYNPNEYRVDASKITYVFWVDTVRVATGTIDRLLTLEQKGRSRLTVPVNFGFNEVTYAMREYTRRGALDYRVTGEFTLATPFGNLTRPYSGTGRLEGMPD